MRSAKVSHESTSCQVTNILCNIQLLVWSGASHALLRDAGVDLIVLELADLLKDMGSDPGTMADTSTLENQSKDE